MPGQSETPLFDPAAIEKLRAIGGDEGGAFVVEMARLFLDEATKSLDELKRGGQENDWKDVSRIAHSLKSSAASLGLMRLSAACKALELDTKSGAPSPRTASLSAIVFKEFEEAKPALFGLS